LLEPDVSHKLTPSITLCLLVSSLLVAAQIRTPDDRDWSWLNDHRSDAFDKLLPVEHDGAYVAYRQYRDLYQDVPEQYFTIRVTGPTGALAATVASPADTSIQQQLLDMHMADRLASLDSLVSRIKLQRHQLTSTTCSALRPRLDALSKVAISIQTTDTIVLHPFVHRIVLDLGGGRIDASLHGDEQPLVQWARTTFDALSRCTHGER
jgi:hypothetical protein